VGREWQPPLPRSPRCLSWTGWTLHGLPSAGLRERTWCPGTRGLLGSPRLSADRDKAAFTRHLAIELNHGSKDFTEGRPGELDWKVLTSPDPAERAKKLFAEIANGRLSTAGVVGILLLDGLPAAPGVTEGCAWPPLLGPSRTSLASRLPWASGIPSVSQLMVTRLPSPAAVRLG